METKKKILKKSLFDSKTFSALFFLINKTLLQTKAIWISFAIISLILCIPQYLIFIVYGGKSFSDHSKLLIITYFACFQSMVFLLFGVINTFTGIMESTVSERIGSNGISKTKFIFYFIIIFIIIGISILFILTFIWFFATSFYMNNGLNLFDNFFSILFYEIMFVLFVIIFSLFISSLKIGSRAKTMYMVLIIITFFDLNYAGAGLLSKLDELNLPNWFEILKWIYLILINPLVLPSSLVWFIAKNPTQINQLWFILYPFYMILTGGLLVFGSIKIFNF